MIVMTPNSALFVESIEIVESEEGFELIARRVSGASFTLRTGSQDEMQTALLFIQMELQKGKQIVYYLE